MPQQKIEMPKIEAASRREFDLDGSAGWLKCMDRRKAKFLCTIEWSWSPAHERMDSYYLQRDRTHWILWLRSYDDNWMKWEKPIAIARCLWKGLGYNKDAAMTLLAAFLAENLRCWDPDLDHFHTVTDTGLLPSGELDAVVDAVWGNTSVSRGTQNDR